MARTTAPAQSPAAPTPSDAALAGQLRLVVSRLHRLLRHQQAGGLMPSQLSALATIDRHGPIRLGELACREQVSPPTLTRCAAALEDLGLAQRRPDPADGRSVQIAITAAGRTLLHDLREERTALLSCRINGLDENARRALTAALPVLERLVADQTK
jgi:DNA-binding MarR family transcriptional regulator